VNNKIAHLAFTCGLFIITVDYNTELTVNRGNGRTWSRSRRHRQHSGNTL